MLSIHTLHNNAQQKPCTRHARQLTAAAQADPELAEGLSTAGRPRHPSQELPSQVRGPAISRAPNALAACQLTGIVHCWLGDTTSHDSYSSAALSILAQLRRDRGVFQPLSSPGRTPQSAGAGGMPGGGGGAADGDDDFDDFFGSRASNPAATAAAPLAADDLLADFFGLEPAAPSNNGGGIGGGGGGGEQRLSSPRRAQLARDAAEALSSFEEFERRAARKVQPFGFSHPVCLLHFLSLAHSFSLFLSA